MDETDNYWMHSGVMLLPIELVKSAHRACHQVDPIAVQIGHSSILACSIAKQIHTLQARYCSLGQSSRFSQ
jgi:hypothetical protein